LTIGCDGAIVGIKTEEGRGSVHYELIWEIPGYRGYQALKRPINKITGGEENNGNLKD
jgi:hypothetical protein